MWSPSSLTLCPASRNLYCLFLLYTNQFSSCMSMTVCLRELEDADAEKISKADKEYEEKEEEVQKKGEDWKCGDEKESEEKVGWEEYRGRKRKPAERRQGAGRRWKQMRRQWRGWGGNVLQIFLSLSKSTNNGGKENGEWGRKWKGGSKKGSGRLGERIGYWKIENELENGEGQNEENGEGQEEENGGK